MNKAVPATQKPMTPRCRRCNGPLPIRDAMAYGSVCEECWAGDQPAGIKTRAPSLGDFGRAIGVGREQE
jgi:hypothetical protein